MHDAPPYRLTIAMFIFVVLMLLGVHSYVDANNATTTIGACIANSPHALPLEANEVETIRGRDAWFVGQGGAHVMQNGTRLGVTYLPEAELQDDGLQWYRTLQWYAYQGRIYVMVLRSKQDAQFPHGICFLEVILDDMP